MCLDMLDKTLEPCSKGYKIMGLKNNRLFGEWQAVTKPRKRRSWLQSKDFGIESLNLCCNDTVDCYPPGWHTYHKLEDAMSRMEHYFAELMKVVEVSVRDPVAVGLQNGCKVTVSKQIKINKIVS